MEYTTYLEIVLVWVLTADRVLEVQSLWTQRAHESAVIDGRVGQSTGGVRYVGHQRTGEGKKERRRGHSGDMAREKVGVAVRE